MTHAQPHNEDAELELLGSILANLECLNEVEANHPKISEYFWDYRHRAIFEAVSKNHDNNLLVVCQSLRESGDLDKVGGMPFLAALEGKAVGITAEATRAAEMLQVEYVRRRLIETGWRIQQSGAEKPVDEALESAEKSVMEIGQSLQGDADPDIKSLMIAASEEMDEAIANQGKIRGLCTGFRDFDWLTKGLKPGQLVIIAARPGVGKTTLAMNIAENVAVDGTHPTAVFSLEMTGTELAHRLACSRARVDSELVQTGKINEGQGQALRRAMVKISNSPLQICEKGGLTIGQLSARARRMHQRRRLKLIIVDYLQLLHSRRENRVSQITEISNGLKTLAKDLKVPLIALSQLSRDCEKEDREPRLSDLRESGSIEQDADIVVLLAPKIQKDSKPDEDPQRVDAKIPKHRGGRIGKVELNFFKSYTRFESVSRFEDVP
jgi:replicative DNA helicase